MRRIVFVCVFVAVFAITGTSALANDANDGRIGQAPGESPGGVPCYGLYNAGVGIPPGSGGATVGTPGWVHVEENDEEMCHQRKG
jgi:hypothetical protein